MHEIFKKVAKIYLKDGSEKVHNKNYESALIDLDKALNLDSNLYEAYFYKGFAKRELRLYEESIEHFKKMLSIDPYHVAALLQMSYSLCCLERYPEALVILAKVIEIVPDWYTFMQRAGIKKLLGDLEGATLDEDTAWKIGHDFSY